MPKINVLPKNIAELIAAGEVVERPASVVKELVENSIDAGATTVTVEINRGGITYMRVTDNGCGISKDDIQKAFLRHATSKIISANDLNKIFTLGFRGEALASICAVSRVEVLTAQKGNNNGTSYVIHGGEEVSLEDAGCPDGTTVIVRDLFYNVPARMKFLKKDVKEGTTVAAIMERLALSHPEVAFHFIRDGKKVLTTSGDGKLRSAVYSVLGRDYSASMIEFPLIEGAVTVSGYTCVPSSCRPNRNGQFFFINGRYIKSGTISAALDAAYKNSAMVGKFPSAIVNLKLNPELVDVNVHPTKTEVRFTDEKIVFESVYRAVKAALSEGDRRPQMNISRKSALNIFSNDAGNQITSSFENDKENLLFGKQKSVGTNVIEPISCDNKNLLIFNDDSTVSADKLQSLTADEIRVSDKSGTLVLRPEAVQSNKFSLDIEPDEPTEQSQKKVTEAPQSEKENSAEGRLLPTDSETGGDNVQEKGRLLSIHYVGEAFSIYIIVTVGDELYFIDKHAAHERINFEKLKAEKKVNSQLLLEPVPVVLVSNEYEAVISNTEAFEKYGFDVEDFGNGTVIVRAVPVELSNDDVPLLISEIAGNIIEKGQIESEREDAILHSIACKSAIKAGYITSKQEQLALAEKVLSSKELMYCPHGRPIAFKLTKNEIEKQFGRLV